MNLKRSLATLLVAFILTACTPEEVAWWREHFRAQTSTCHGAVDALWPERSRAWAHRIVERESHGIATAQNRSSTAAGCLQLLAMHAWRFDAVGCSWRQRYNAECNIRAGLHLYAAAGTAPWS